MGGEIPTQQLLDKLSRQDEIMAMMIPLLREIRDKPAPQQTTPAELIEMRDILKTQRDIDREVFTLTYPRDGTRLTIAAGTTTFDFLAGTVAAPGVDVADMGNSLMLQRKEFMRALTINADHDVIIRIGSGYKMPIRAGSFPIFPYLQFTTVAVTVAKSTEIFISVSTSSAAIVQMGVDTLTTGGLTPFAYESKTIAATAAGFTAGTYDDATHAEMTLETAQIRIRSDGIAPTSSEGRLIGVGDTIVLKSAAQIAAFKAIRTGAVSGVLKVEYFH